MYWDISALVANEEVPCKLPVNPSLALIAEAVICPKITSLPVTTNEPVCEFCTNEPVFFQIWTL